MSAVAAYRTGARGVGAPRVRGDSEPDTECAKNLHHRADARIALTGRATRNLTAFETADA